VNVSNQRFHDETGTGPLTNPNGAQPKGRRSYTASWFDPIGRTIASADYGTNGGAALIRPETVPQRSDIVLVSSQRYAANGESNASIDPMGVDTRWVNDAAGRRVRLIEAACDGKSTCAPKVPNSYNDGERISEYAYTADGQLARLTLVNAVTGNQVTRWVYGTTLTDSGEARRDLLRAKIYPESDDEAAPLNNGLDGVYNRIEYTYNRQGNIVTMKDPNETVHAYAFDLLGRQVADAVTVLGTGVDGAVRRIATAYEVRGMVLKVTSYDAASAGDVVNEVAYAYDGFGQLTEDAQAHDGAVDGSTPKVLYAHADGATGNTSRRVSMTYPDGRVILWSYGSEGEMDDVLSRVHSLTVDGEEHALVSYTYVGAARFVKIVYPEPEIELSYIKAVDQPIGDAGDPYTGYDRFGRTVDMKWQDEE